MIIWSFATWHFFASLTHGFSCSWWYNNKKSSTKSIEIHIKKCSGKSNLNLHQHHHHQRAFIVPFQFGYSFTFLTTKSFGRGPPLYNTHSHANGSLAGVYDLWWALMHGCYYFHISVRGFVYSCALLPCRCIVFLFFFAFSSCDCDRHWIVTNVQFIDRKPERGVEQFLVGTKTAPREELPVTISTFLYKRSCYGFFDFPARTFCHRGVIFPNVWVVPLFACCDGNEESLAKTVPIRSHTVSRSLSLSISLSHTRTLSPVFF